MNNYIGTKILKAKPITLGDYNTYRGWIIPEDEDPNDKGYLVKDESGRESFLPEETFNRDYSKTDAMTFGLAIEAMKKGHKVARAGWNGKGMWIVYMTPMYLPAYNTQGTVRKVNDRTANLIGEDMPLNTLGYIAMWTATKEWLPGWLASQTDMLAEDWMVVE